MSKQEGSFSNGEALTSDLEQRVAFISEAAAPNLYTSLEEFFGHEVPDTEERRRELYVAEASSRIAAATALKPTPALLAQDRLMEFAPEQTVSTAPLSDVVDFPAQSSTGGYAATEPQFPLEQKPLLN